jgi:hypothetical protein
MKTAQSRPSEASDLRSKAEAALEEHVAGIFRRIPVLTGFAVRDDYEFDDVSVFTWPGYSADEELLQELVVALTELADERPEAAKLLGGRTFARAIN